LIQNANLFFQISKEGIPRDCYDSNHNSPVDVIKRLLSNGASFTARLCNQNTPLHITAFSKGSDVFKNMLQVLYLEYPPAYQRLVLSSKNQNNQTPLDIIFQRSLSDDDVQSMNQALQLQLQFLRGQLQSIHNSLENATDKIFRAATHYLASEKKFIEPPLPSTYVDNIEKFYIEAKDNALKKLRHEINTQKASLLLEFIKPFINEHIYRVLLLPKDDLMIPASESNSLGFAYSGEGIDFLKEAISKIYPSFDHANQQGQLEVFFKNCQRILHEAHSKNFSDTPLIPTPTLIFSQQPVHQATSVAAAHTHTLLVSSNQK